jgi:threonylcarbamoyladenosine tRNA methylthiotransferase MtaB
MTKYPLLLPYMCTKKVIVSKAFKVVTLGCRANQYESQVIRGQLKGIGYVEVGGGEQADICIINTCTVTTSADSHSRNAIRREVKKNAGATIVVTGCLAERDAAMIEGIEGVTHIVPNNDKESLVALIAPDVEVPAFVLKSYSGKTRAFVKIQDGCDSYCTYCIIPSVRGTPRSRDHKEIFAEVEALVQQGYKEVVLTGINIGTFGKDKGYEYKLADLIVDLEKIEGLQRLRLSSISPLDIDEALLQCFADSEVLCPSAHMVLQSGSDAVLRRMNRSYTQEQFVAAAKTLRDIDPDFAFTTDVIVGFPGETEEDCEETLAVIREVGFTGVHVFPYSVRPGTRAERYKDHVPSHIITKRKERVLSVVEAETSAARQRFVGMTVKVLVERINEGEGVSYGHTDNFLDVKICGVAPKKNAFIDVCITENSSEGCVGKMIERVCCK